MALVTSLTPTTPMTALTRQQALDTLTTAGKLFKMPKPTLAALPGAAAGAGLSRSEERRVGKECGDECRSRWSPYH